MSIPKTKKISVGTDTYDLKNTIYYYLTIDIVLPEVREYQAMIFDLKPAYKDLNELEDQLFSNCVNVAKLLGVTDKVMQRIEDIKALFRHFQGYPVMRQYLTNRQCDQAKLDIAFSEIEKAGSEGAISKSVFDLFKKIKSKHAGWTTAQFLRQRDNLYAQVQMNEYGQL